MVPDDFAARWKEFGARGASAREAREARLTPNAAEFRRRMAGDLPKGNEAAVAAARAALFAKPKAVATRKASQNVMLSQERQSA